MKSIMGHPIVKQGLKLRSIFTLLLFTVGCSNPGGTGVDEVVSPFDVNQYPLNKLVCDPFGGSQDPGIAGGLMAELYYLDDEQSRFYNVSDYIEQGVKSEQTLFFSQLNVPTRLFDLGFPTETGEMVKKDNGDDLVEFFALRFSSILKLGPNDLEGQYELAILSDDGAIWRLRDDQGVYQEVVNNDGDHPTRMGCGAEVIEMTAETEMVMQLDYYQGPRYHISAIPMWRRVDGARQSEAMCGRQGNSLYFDYNNGSSANVAYTELLARGWKPLTTDNYTIPQTAMFNPCTEGQSVTISNFRVEDLYDGLMHVTWQTDSLATSQVRYVDLETGEETVTLSDNVMRTEHSVYVHGMMPGKTYVVQAVSISGTYGKALSENFTIQIR